MSEPESKPVRCAVIGYGGAFNMGRAHGEQMIAAGMQLVAACDLDAARVSQASQDFPGIRAYTSVDELLADPGVDLVTVILPHNLHASVAIKAANAGKHVIVEKPMCVSVAEADAMIDAAKTNKVMLSVFHNRRWDGDYMSILELIRKGVIGEVFHIEACMGGFSDPGAWWRSDKKISGGAFFDWGAHIVDWTLHFLPEKIQGVDGYFHKLKWMNRTNEDHTECVIRFANGATAQVEISSISAAGKAKWRILGTKGSIVMQGWDMINVTVEHDGYMAKFDVRPQEGRWPEYYKNIADHLVHGADLAVKPEEARRIIAVLEAAERSSAAKHTVEPAYS